MPTGIATTDCSCPYDWEGDCKHIVALLLTYIHEPEAMLSLEPLFATLAAKPKSSLLKVISELLKRAPQLAHIIQVYADIPTPPPDSGPLPLVAVYREQIDNIFGDSFFEQHQLYYVVTQLEDMRQQAEFLTQLDETERALSILHALIHQSIVRYSDTLDNNELLQFIDECITSFTQIVADAPESVSIQEHCRMLLQLSFDVEESFTSVLTYFLERVCSTQETADLQVMVEQNLDKSPDRQAHVHLLLGLYVQSGRTEDGLRLAQSERER